MGLDEKAHLRRQMKATRGGLTPEQREQLSREISGRVLDFLRPRGCGCVALFASIGAEVSTASAAHTLRKNSVQTVYPRCVGKKLEFAPVEGDEDFIPGTMGILEPTTELVEVNSIDAIVVPGLAFDVAGRRLGYGGGYYDRTLAAYAGLTLGVCFGVQVVPRVPVEDYDRPVAHVITEAGCVGGAADHAGAP